MIWAAVVLSFLPVLRLDLYLSDQFIAAQFFISSFILVLAWPLSGPLVAALLSFLSSALAIYLGLGIKEPSYFLTLVFNAVLFLWMAVTLQGAQRRTRDLSIMKEKLSEDMNWTVEEIQKKKSLKTALQKKINNFLDLERFSEELKEDTTLGGIAQKMAQKAREVLPASNECRLFIVNETQQELTLVGGAPDPRVDSPSGTPIDQWVLKHGQAVMVEDVRNDFRFASENPSKFGSMRSACAIPLMTENRVLGVMRASASKPSSFTADDSRLLDIFSSLGAVTLKNILLFERMSDLATHDSLTGLFVNRAFQAKLAEAVEKSTFDKEPFSVILLDIDHFKRYNDEYGHSAGDLVLKNIALILKDALEAEDAPARYGGEEFAVLMPGRDKKKALKIAEILRSGIEKNVFTLRRTHRRVTASLGVASYPTDGRTKDELLWACDTFLYQAKKSGRNCVCGGT